MLDPNKRKYLFKCQDCQLILSAEFEEKEDLEDLQDNKMTLQCPCDGKCIILRD